MGERDHLTTMPWNPDRYHQFQKERSAPFEDALALVTVRAGLRVVDLGCGTGELTRRLADALPDCDALGLDSSAEMLAKAAPTPVRVCALNRGRLRTSPAERERQTTI